MDQATFNLIFGSILTALGWFGRMLWERQELLLKGLQELEVKLVGEYVNQDTFNQVLMELRNDVRYIRNRLDEQPNRRQGDPL